MFLGLEFGLMCRAREALGTAELLELGAALGLEFVHDGHQ
jgi:hypothetical protein